MVCQDSVVSIVTHCGLDCPVMESGGDEIFCSHPNCPWDPPSLLYNGYWVIPGGKVARGIVLTTYPHVVLMLYDMICYI